jgi:8-oxo-dGTP pyrophosphatase MutT (NUDIX family)
MTGPGKRRQAAAIPYRITDRGPEVLLVTSTSSGKWILPKGNVDPGNTPSQTAGIEAFEEAGVVGVPWPEAVGEYDYEKESVPLRVEVFPLKVDQVLENWAESKVRQRRWASLAEAIRVVGEPGVQAVLGQFADWLRQKP